MKIANQPREIVQRVAEFLKDGDLEGIVSMFHHDCHMFFPPTEPPKIGQDAAREVFRDFIPVRPTLSSTVTSEVIVGDTAILSGSWEIVDNDGNLLGGGNSTEVAKRLPNGGWVYYIDCPLGLPTV